MKWDKFQNVIEKAKSACINAGEVVDNHFPQVEKLVAIGSGAFRPRMDMLLTRYACYLIAQNGDASKPEIFERCWENSKFSPLYYLNGLLCNQIDDEKLNRAKVRMSKTLDQSVYAADTDPNGGYVIHEGEVIDLSKVDLDAVREGRNRTLHGSSWIIRSHRHCFK